MLRTVSCCWPVVGIRQRLRLWRSMDVDGNDSTPSDGRQRGSEAVTWQPASEGHRAAAVGHGVLYSVAVIEPMKKVLRSTRGVPAFARHRQNITAGLLSSASLAIAQKSTDEGDTTSPDSGGSRAASPARCSGSQSGATMQMSSSSNELPEAASKCAQQMMMGDDPGK